MKICLFCRSIIPNDKAWHCISCGWKPISIDDVVQFSPNISGASESYDPSWYKELATLETTNYWFVARNRLIQLLAKRYLSFTTSYLELGCGTGYVLQMLCKTFPSWSFSAAEGQHDGIFFAKSRVKNGVNFYQMDACSIPFCNEFDAIGAFDVIEHIANDVAAIEQIHSALNPGGYFILSVPQHMFLWSKFDEVGCHHRRYSAKELHNKLNAAGFKIITSMSFNSLLLPLMIISRKLKIDSSNANLDVLDELRLSPLISFVLSSMLYVEFLLIRIGIRFPFGGSRVVIAQKPVN